LPIYEDEGRHLMHLGLSGGWRDGSNNLGSGINANDTIRVRARPELRDDDPAASPGSNTNANGVGGAGQFLPDANANRIVDVGNITCDTEYLIGTEFLYIRGPWSFQAEYGWNFLNNAQVGAKSVQNYEFNGGYLQLSYILTGEYRHYDKKWGTLSRYYLGGTGPDENAFLVRDALGDFCCGKGAWELALRYSYVDLNSDLGSTDPVKGGIANGLTVGLNWYLNTNLSVMTDWNYCYRYDANQVSGNLMTTNPINNGSTNGFGTEVQVTF
jgi:phosphate-selective porin OprO/OprP